MQPETTYLRYIDEQGTIHVVSNLDEVPKALRDGVERFTLRDTSPSVMNRAEAVLDKVQAIPTPLFWGGGAALLLVALFLWKLWKRAVWLAALIALAGVALLGTTYLGAIRKQAGLAPSLTGATPSDVLDDARQAVGKLKERERAMREELERVQKQEGF